MGGSHFVRTQRAKGPGKILRTEGFEKVAALQRAQRRQQFIKEKNDCLIPCHFVPVCRSIREIWLYEGTNMSLLLDFKRPLSFFQSSVPWSFGESPKRLPCGKTQLRCQSRLWNHLRPSWAAPKLLKKQLYGRDSFVKKENLSRWNTMVSGAPTKARNHCWGVAVQSNSV